MFRQIIQRNTGTVLAASFLLVACAVAQPARKKVGWPSQVVLVRDEISPAGSLGHLLVNGKEVAKTLEPNGETAQITVSRAHLHYVSGSDKEGFAVVLDDLDDGDSGKKLTFSMGGLNDRSAGYVLLGTRYESKTITADLATESGKQLLKEAEQENAGGKQLHLQVNGNTLQLEVQEPVEGSQALARLREALNGTAPSKETNLVVNFDFRASDEYKQQVLGISESIARQLTIDEKRFVIKAMEIPSETSGTDSAGSDGAPKSGTLTGNPGDATVSGSTSNAKPGDVKSGDAKPGSANTSEGKTPSATKLAPQKASEEHNSVEQGSKRSAEPDQPTTFDNKPTPPVQQTDKKKAPPPD